ncbi:MAG: ImmA/IrrE family metallo-endopeptidase [Pseudonocardiaceae bacterium]|nr:ImmA/IrrE family metallo-endopeptidase [Pseudonocardiaceae bacterium]
MSSEDAIRARVRRVIERSGRSQAAFARVIELEPTKLSKALAGTRRFTPLELALIAEQGQTSTDWLLHGSQERPSLAARAHDLDTIEATPRAYRRAEELDEVYDTLAAAGFAREAPRLPYVRSSGRMVDQGAALATRALDFVAASGARSDVVEDLPDTVERVFGTDVGIEDLPGFDGLAWCRNGFRLLLISNGTSWTRQRYTIAHELGHVLAGDAQDLRVDLDVMTPSAEHAQTEMRANAFAAAFLMPAGMITSRWHGVDESHFARLVGELRVSPSALAWRLLNLGLVTTVQRAHLGSIALWECAERGSWLDSYRALTRNQSEIRRPGLLSREALRAFEDGSVSARVAARVLDILPETLLPTSPPHDEADGSVENDLTFAP